MDKSVIDELLNEQFANLIQLSSESELVHSETKTDISALDTANINANELGDKKSTELNTNVVIKSFDIEADPEITIIASSGRDNKNMDNADIPVTQLGSVPTMNGYIDHLLDIDDSIETIASSIADAVVLPDEAELKSDKDLNKDSANASESTPNVAEARLVKPELSDDQKIEPTAESEKKEGTLASKTKSKPHLDIKTDLKYREIEDDDETPNIPKSAVEKPTKLRKKDLAGLSSSLKSLPKLKTPDSAGTLDKPTKIKKKFVNGTSEDDEKEGESGNDEVQVEEKPKKLTKKTPGEEPTKEEQEEDKPKKLIKKSTASVSSPVDAEKAMTLKKVAPPPPSKVPAAKKTMVEYDEMAAKEEAEKTKSVKDTSKSEADISKPRSAFQSKTTNRVIVKSANKDGRHVQTMPRKLGEGDAKSESVITEKKTTTFTKNLMQSIAASVPAIRAEIVDQVAIEIDEKSSDSEFDYYSYESEEDTNSIEELSDFEYYSYSDEEIHAQRFHVRQRKQPSRSKRSSVSGKSKLSQPKPGENPKSPQIKELLDDDEDFDEGQDLLASLMNVASEMSKPVFEEESTGNEGDDENPFKEVSQSQELSNRKRKKGLRKSLIKPKTESSDEDESENSAIPLQRNYTRKSRRALTSQDEDEEGEDVLPLFGKVTEDDEKLMEMRKAYVPNESQLILKTGRANVGKLRGRKGLNVSKVTQQQTHMDNQMRKRNIGADRNTIKAKNTAEMDAEEYTDLILGTTATKKPQKKLPKALNDPRVRKQLERMKLHKPYFSYAMIIIQGIIVLSEFIFSYVWTGDLIGRNPLNFMIGPDPLVLIKMGARFVPCMVNGWEDNYWDCSKLTEFKNATVTFPAPSSLTQALTAFPTEPNGTQRLFVRSLEAQSYVQGGYYQFNSNPSVVYSDFHPFQTVERRNFPALGQNSTNPPPPPPSGTRNVTRTGLCKPSQLCGYTYGNPNQYWRVFTAIFLHGGLVHYGLNAMHFYNIGPGLEEVYGSFSIAMIYFLSGVGGFLFGGMVVKTGCKHHKFALILIVVSIGASGAIYGINACVVLDLLLNFQLVQNRWRELAKQLVTVALYLGLGLLPYIDNFAHVGGFVIGLMAGLWLMKPVYFGSVDRTIKTFLKFASIPILVIILIFFTIGFMSTSSTCSWCIYVDCLPIYNWCDGLM